MGEPSPSPSSFPFPSPSPSPYLYLYPSLSLPQTPEYFKIYVEDPKDIHDKSVQQGAFIRLLVLITVSLFALILILGHIRYRGNNLTKLIGTYTFIITAILVTFIAGLMNKPGSSTDIYVFWVAFMAYLSAVANQTSCYTLGENEDRRKKLLIDYLVIWPLVLSFLYKNLVSPEITVALVLVFWVVMLKLRERSHALSCATTSSDGLARASKIISYFTQCQKGTPQCSSTQVNNFLVGVKGARCMVAERSSEGSKLKDIDLSSAITLDDIMSPSDHIMSPSDHITSSYAYTNFWHTYMGRQVQDTALSFSMFWVLLAKITGHDNVDPKLYKDGNELPVYSFDLVQKELSFLYEYLFTNNYAIYDRGWWKKLHHLFITLLFIWLTLPLLTEYSSEGFLETFDNRFTNFAIIAIVAIELAQIVNFHFSKWAEVMVICTYVSIPDHKSRKKTIFQGLIKTMCHGYRLRRRLFGCFKAHRRNRIRQYSIFECYGAIPLLRWAEGCILNYVSLPRMGYAGNWTLDWTDEFERIIIDAVNHCVLVRGAEVTNGIYTLKHYEVHESVLSTYVRSIKIQARAILIWHVATRLLEDDPDIPITPPNTDFNHSKIAAAISRYSAYLVAFLPQILPDDVYATRFELNEAIKELEKDNLRVEQDNDHPKGGLYGEDSIFKEGKELKEKLQHMPNVWQIVAEFWIERLMFMALSYTGEAVKAHIDNLCVGGEFITYLWALLTHAGCSRSSNEFGL